MQLFPFKRAAGRFGSLLVTAVRRARRFYRFWSAVDGTALGGEQKSKAVTHTALQKRQPGELPFISVIVPVRNEEKHIEKVLRSLLNQTYPASKFEVLVADGGSTDNTRSIIQDLQCRYSNLRLLDNPNRLSSAGRNVAIRSSNGNVAVVVDGHCELDNPTYLSRVAALFRTSAAECLGRPQPLRARTPWERAIAAARSSWVGHHPASFIYSASNRFVPPQSVAVAYRRGVFQAVGLFDERFDACEDVEFNYRVHQAGMACFFSDQLSVAYFPRNRPGKLFQQMQRYGRGRKRLLGKHPATLSLCCLVPELFVAFVVLGGMVSLLSKPIAGFYLAILALYALIVGAESARIARRLQSWRLLPRVAWVFPTIHWGIGVGSLRESIGLAVAKAACFCGRPGQKQAVFVTRDAPAVR